MNAPLFKDHCIGPSLYWTSRSAFLCISRHMSKEILEFQFLLEQTRQKRKIYNYDSFLSFLFFNFWLRFYIVVLGIVFFKASFTSSNFYLDFHFPFFVRTFIALFYSDLSFSIRLSIWISILVSIWVSIQVSISWHFGFLPIFLFLYDDRKWICNIYVYVLCTYIGPQKLNSRTCN